MLSTSCGLPGATDVTVSPLVSPPCPPQHKAAHLEASVDFLHEAERLVLAARKLLHARRGVSIGMRRGNRARRLLARQTHRERHVVLDRRAALQLGHLEEPAGVARRRYRRRGPWHRLRPRVSGVRLPTPGRWLTPTMAAAAAAAMFVLGCVRAR